MPVTSGWQNKLARVSHMEWDELRMRLAQAIHKRGDLLRHQLGIPREAIQLHEGFGEGKFFFAPCEVAARAELLRQRLPAEADSIVREAAEICDHNFRLLGYENLDYRTGRDIDWHLDRVHGKRAPLDPWFQIPFLEFAAVGDHKITWELNRHQHLVTLAKAWVLTGDERYIRELTTQWRSWINSNRYPLGINWGSTLEVAFRSLSWIWVDHLLAGAPGHATYRAELLPALAFHGRYIDRYLSTYFSPNTHLLGEAVAMLFLGVLYPKMPHAERWKESGWKIVLREAGRQVRPDGVYFEQSLYYHVYALDFFLYARTLASANDMPVPEAYDEVLLTMLNLVEALAQAGPAEGFGDDDGGRLFNPRRNHTEHMTDPLALGAVVYSRDDLAAAQLTEESIWLFGERAVAQLAPTRAERTTNSAGILKTSSAAFPDGGVYILADSVPCRQTMMIDAGPQGAGRCGHGHADALSLRLTIHGSRWLVDSGTGVYVSSDPADRNSFRGTSAHNTIRVDNVDQAVPGEPFSWTKIPTSNARTFIVGRTFTFFTGSHDGYVRLADAVTHRRSVLRVNGCATDDGLWLVRDVLLGGAEHDLDLHWHFASDLILREACAGELVATKVEASQCEANQPALRLLWPQPTVWKTQFTQGLISPSYGRYRPAPVVRSEARVKLPAEIATAFFVEPDAARLREPASMVSVHHPDAQAYELHTGGDDHGFFFSRDGRPWSFGPWSCDAELLYCRTQDKRITQLIVIGGSSVEWQGRPLLPAHGPFKYFEWRKQDGALHAEPAPFPTTFSFDELVGNSPSPTSNTSNQTSSYAEKH